MKCGVCGHKLPCYHCSSHCEQEAENYYVEGYLTALAQLAKEFGLA